MRIEDVIDPKKHYLVSDEEIRTFVKKLAKQIPFKPRGVYGPAKGGTYYSLLLSDMLNIPMLNHPITKSEGGIIIDDVADRGVALLKYRPEAMAKLLKTDETYKSNQDKEYYIATHFYKEGCLWMPDYYGEKTDKWLIFPHEHEEFIRGELNKRNKDGNAAIDIS